MMIRLASLSFIVLWATGFVGAKMGMPYGEPASFLFVRFAIAFLLMALIAFFTRSKWPTGIQFFHLIIIGMLIHAIHLGGVFWAIRHQMPGGIAAVIVGTQPLLTGLLARYWVGERLSRYHWYGVALGLVGLLLALGINTDILQHQALRLAPVISCFVSVFAIALGTVYQKLHAGNVNLITGTGVQFIGATLFTFVFALLFESFQIEWNSTSIFAMVWLVLVLSIAAIFLLMWLIRQESVAQVANLFYLVPPIGALMTWALFDEELTIIQIFGFILCSIAVLLSSLKKPA